MKRNKILFSIAFFCLTITLLLTVIDFNCFDVSFYKKEYAQNNTCEATGMNEEDLMDTTQVLFDYLHDERDDLIVEHSVNGSLREIFDSREKAHMVDVKNLYLNAIKVRNILLVIGIGFIVIGIFLDKKNIFNPVLSGYKIGVSFLLLIVVCILIYAAIDFNSFWLQFHYIFFSNDLFLLDPNTEILINMVPEQFFFDLVIHIIWMFFVGIVVPYIVLSLLNKKLGKVND